MTNSSVERSRIRDGVRDSKIRLDISSKLNRWSDLLLPGSIQASTEQRHHRKLDVRHVERDFARLTVDEISRRFRHCNSQDAKKGWNTVDFSSYFDEAESCFNVCNEDEALFHGFYNGYVESDSLIARFKRNLPVFDGFWHIENLLTWIDAIEDFFEEINPPEHLKCKIVWYKMKGAYYWWKHLQNGRIEQGKEEITSWPRMKKLLLKKFSPTKCSTNCPNQQNQWVEEGMKVMKDDAESFCASGMSACEMHIYLGPNTVVPFDVCKDYECEKPSSNVTVIGEFEFGDTTPEQPSQQRVSQLTILNAQTVDGGLGKHDSMSTCYGKETLKEISGILAISSIGTDLRQEIMVTELKKAEFIPPSISLVDVMKINQTPVIVSVMDLTSSESIQDRHSKPKALSLKTIAYCDGLLQNQFEKVDTKRQGVRVDGNAKGVGFLFDPGGSHTFQNLGFYFLSTYCILFKCEAMYGGFVISTDSSVGQILDDWICSLNSNQIAASGNEIYCDSWGFKYNILSCVSRLCSNGLVHSARNESMSRVLKIFADGKDKENGDWNYNTGMEVKIGWESLSHLCLWFATIDPRNDDDCGIEKETYGKNLHIKMNVVVFTPLLDYTKNAINGVDEVKKQTRDLWKKDSATTFLLQMRSNPLMPKAIKVVIGREQQDHHVSYYVEGQHKMDIGSLPDDNMGLTDPGFCKYEGFNGPITEAVTLLFDPGGVPCLLIKRNFGNYFFFSFSSLFNCTIPQVNVVTELLSIGTVSTWDPCMMLKNNIAKSKESCLCLLSDNAPDSLALSSVSCHLVGGRFVTGHSFGCLIHMRSSWMHGIYKEKTLAFLMCCLEFSESRSNGGNSVILMLRYIGRMKEWSASIVADGGGIYTKVAGYCVILGATGTEMLGVLSSDFRFLWDGLYNEDSSIYPSPDLTRRRAIALKGWNGIGNYDTIIDKLYIVTISSCLRFLCTNGQPREFSKLFHNVLNGLDPPMDLDGVEAPFAIGYTKCPNMFVDLAPITHPKSNAANNLAHPIQQRHDAVKANLQNGNASYKCSSDVHRRVQEYAVGDLVIILMRKERFPDHAPHVAASLEDEFMILGKDGDDVVNAYLFIINSLF